MGGRIFRCSVCGSQGPPSGKKLKGLGPLPNWVLFKLLPQLKPNQKQVARWNILIKFRINMYLSLIFRILLWINCKKNSRRSELLSFRKTLCSNKRKSKYKNSPGKIFLNETCTFWGCQISKLSEEISPSYFGINYCPLIIIAYFIRKEGGGECNCKRHKSSSDVITRSKPN